ncbi:cohesin domain-containing protein [Paenibacillus sp. SYP-B4298]|uniref:cohesin domain-containing protein n=1 Tax=Paenibacillus sp. SYP-B4298 TaxID=2996034 RepID=UPI0022DD4924|nr:cohesin domain-containing protein [Paenibacillus sp. SYP-B4298]
MRKKAFIWIMTLSMIVSMLPFSSSAVTADSVTSVTSKTIYVATNGNDNTGDGTQDKPYKTVAKAKEVVKTLPKTGGDIVVQIADGFYSLDETLVFNKDDSGSASSTVRYEAAPGAKPVISAGEMLEKGVWTEAVGLTQTGGLKAYKTTLKRNDKLRAIYVNDKIANMTLSSPIVSANRTVNGTPTVSFTAADNDWAWRDGNNIRAGIVFDASVGLKTGTKNPQNIEAESVGGSTARWARPFVTFASIEPAPAASNKPDGVMLRFQMPYGAISQSLSNNTQYNPGNNQVIRNAFEFFNKRGDFYFDQAESTLYYIPLEGEDINKADVVIPKLETVLDIRGIPVGDRLNPIAGSDDGRVKHITFKGLKFAHTDYKLFELTGTYTLSDGSGKVTTTSRGYASVQGSIVNTVYFPSSINWHETFYRGYDIPPAAIMINAARNIKVLNGEIMLTGFNGIHVENDVKDIEVTGNYIADTLASGIVIGHPHHIYENDVPIKHESSVQVSGTPIRSWAGVDKEKFKAGTEAVPENIYITNNFFFRNCYGFPGANTLASFYTTNMQVLHNYFYDSTYGALSIGWGWDEYDGFGFTAQGTNKTGGPYHGTHETSVARSPEISTTSRNNKINYNRVEEICTIVNDSGAIYSLGRQGDPGTLPGGGTWDTVSTLTNNPVTDKTSNWHSDNWTNYTEMNYNFLDPNPTGKPTTSNNWTNGFHPDEGSTFIKMIGNVVQSKLSHAPGQSRLFEFNNWKRKSDMIAIEGYVDGDNNQNGGPRITYDNYKSEARIWPVKGNEIVLNSGLTDEYTHMIPRSLIADTEFELASNVIVGVGGEKVSRRGLLKAEDTVWLAPANTTVFEEGPTMTKAAGNAKSINTPAAAGQYKLYIVYGDGRATATSKYTAYVDASESTANVENGKSYEVSAVRPLKLTLSNDYIFTLNGTPVADGHEINTAGSWTLVGSTSTPAITIQFSTTVSVANKLLTSDVTVVPGGTVRFKHDLDDATQKIWISSSSGGHFDGGDDETVASGDALGMKAPMLPGPYIIYVLAADGEVLSQSDARVIVSETASVDTAADKALLSVLIEGATDKDSKLYTRSTWKAFERALSDAKTAASNAEIGQTAADNAYYALRNAIKELQLVGKQLVEVFKEDFESGTLDSGKWKGQNNQVSVTDSKVMQFGPTANSNVRAQTVEEFGDMEMTFDFNVNSGTGDQGFYIYFRTTDRTVPANLSNRNGFELAIGPGFNPNLRIFEHVNNNATYQLSGGSTAIQRDSWYKAKIVIEEGMLYTKFWPRDSEEPTQWTMSGAISNGAKERGKGHVSFEFYGNQRSGMIDNVVIKEFREPVLTEEYAEINGPSAVIAGHPVQLSIGIDNLVKGIDAFSVEVNYDPAKFAFETLTDADGVVSLADSAITNVHPDLNILATAVKQQTGKILIIASTKGSLYQNSGELFVLNGRAASSASAGGTSVSLSDFVVTAQADARNISTEEAVLDIQVRITDNSALAAVIEQAEELLSRSKEGSQPGQYPVGSKAVLQGAVQSAILVRDNNAATESDIAQAITALKQAISVFRNSVMSYPDVSKTELTKAIEAAKLRLDTAEKGNKIGQYTSAAIRALDEAIQQAVAVKNDGLASQSTVNQAVTALHEAVGVFATRIVTFVPGQTAVTILDLSYLAKYYGTKSSDSDWIKVEPANLFDSGEITIRELSAVARMIVENWLSE